MCEFLRNILPGTLIISDAFRSYFTVGNIEDANYTHAVVNHAVEFVTDEGYHTNIIEATWGALKRYIPANVRNSKLLQAHLFEQIWRSNNLGATWDALLHAILRIKYNETYPEESDPNVTPLDELLAPIHG